MESRLLEKKAKLRENYLFSKKFNLKKFLTNVFKNPRNNISPHNGGCSIYFQNFWILFLKKDCIESALFIKNINYVRIIIFQYERISNKIIFIWNSISCYK